MGVCVIGRFLKKNFDLKKWTFSHFKTPKNRHFKFRFILKRNFDVFDTLWVTSFYYIVDIFKTLLIFSHWSYEILL